MLVLPQETALPGSKTATARSKGPVLRMCIGYNLLPEKGEG